MTKMATAAKTSDGELSARRSCTDGNRSRGGGETARLHLHSDFVALVEIDRRRLAYDEEPPLISNERTDNE
jgi:hypothetical protein